VRRGTTQRPLRPKPFQGLLYLLEHRDRVVPKQDLAEQLWPELVQEMIGLVLGEHELPAAVRQPIVATTDGVPLFVEEVTKMVLEMGSQHTGAVEAARLERALTQTIPATLHDLLMARLDRLGTAKGVAQLASTIGREFSYALLQALAPWDESTLQRDLRRLVEAELLYQRGMPPQATYLFKHALIRDAAYESLLKRTRKHYHQKIAGALEERFPETAQAQPELLAYHCTLSEAWERAFEYLVRSGDKARQVYANQEAITFYTQAIEASGRITPALDAAQLLPLYEGRGLVWMLLTKYDAAIADFQMMRQTARASGNPQKDGESLCHLAFAHWVTFAAEQLPFVEQYAEEALLLAQRTGDQKILARSLTSLGSIDVWRGNLQEAEQKLDASLRISRQERYQDSLAHHLMLLGAQAYWQGYFPRSTWGSTISPLASTNGPGRTSNQHLSVSSARRRAPTDGAGKYGFSLAWPNLPISREAYEQALRYVEEGLREAQATSSQKYVALGWALRGKIAAQMGDAEPAGTELQRAFALIDQLQSPSLIYPIAYELGYWYESIGKEREATTLYGKAQATIEQMVTTVEEEALRSTLLQSALVQTINERVACLGG